jgi:hypothetical protein
MGLIDPGGFGRRGQAMGLIDPGGFGLQRAAASG